MEIRSITVNFREYGNVTLDFESMIHTEDEELGQMLAQFVAFTDSNMTHLVMTLNEVLGLHSDAVIQAALGWLTSKKEEMS